jgi:hypothetical protein
LKKIPQAGFPSSFPLVSRFDSKKLLVIMVCRDYYYLIDSQIVYIADFIPEQLSSSVGVAAFIAIAIIFAVT